MIQYWDVVGQRVHDVLKGYPRLRLTHGRKVLFVWPKPTFWLIILENLLFNAFKGMFSRL